MKPDVGSVEPTRTVGWFDAMAAARTAASEGSEEVEEEEHASGVDEEEQVSTAKEMDGRRAGRRRRVRMLPTDVACGKGNSRRRGLHARPHELRPST